MTDENYEDLVAAIENIADGLQKLAMLSLDLKARLDAEIEGRESAFYIV